MTGGVYLVQRVVRFTWRTCSAIFFFLALSVTPLAQAALPILPLQEVEVGSHGVARTVISGTRIEEFGVEVLAIMKNKGAAGDLILVRTYGDVIDRAGGVAQGMSGSPVLIGGRLIGAIGFGWSLTDQKTAMVTPIQDMLKLWDLPRTPAIKEAAIDLAPEKTPEQQPAKPPTKEPAKPPTKETPPALSPAPPLSTPLMAAGFGEKALSFLQTKLKPLKLTPVAVGDAPDGIAYGELEPGSAVGVQLIRGDVSLGAIGTVTYVDGDRVLAFGHPFLKRGQADFLMTNAYIFTTIRGLETSFKLGTTGEAIGTVTQDRSAGIAGEMNRYPGIVPMRMNIRSLESGQSRDMSVQLVQDEEIVPILATAALLSAVEKAVDRSGSGTARITFEVAARGMPGETYRRENMFYSPENVSEAALGEFYEFLAFLASNPHNPVTLMDVKAEVSVDPARRTARILSAKPLQLSAKPGGVVDIEVKLKPFRGEPIVQTVGFTVPKEQSPGVLNLNVRGGGFFSLAALLKKLGAEVDNPKPVRKPPKSFEEMMKDFSKRDRNNDIVVELSGSGEFIDEGEGAETKPKLKLAEKEKSMRDAGAAKPEKAKSAPSLLSKRKTEAKNKGVLTTDTIIEGDTEVSIEITAEAVK